MSPTTCRQGQVPARWSTGTSWLRMSTASSRLHATAGEKLQADRHARGAVPATNQSSRPGYTESGICRLAQCGSDLLLAHNGTVVAIDRQRDPTALAEMTSPRQRAVQSIELLEQHAPLLERRGHARSRRTAEYAISHCNAS